MTLRQEIICLDCPLGCRLETTIDERGNILECLGAACKRGLPYAQQEIRAPRRVLTATVITEGSRQTLLPVRTDSPIPKDLLRQCMVYLADLRARPPVKLGQVLVQNILGTGANLIASDDLEA